MEIYPWPLDCSFIISNAFTYEIVVILSYLGLNGKYVKSVHAQCKCWFSHDWLKNICKCDIKWSKQEATTGHVHSSPHLDGFSIPFGSTGNSKFLEVSQEYGGIMHTCAGGKTSAHVIDVCLSIEILLSSLVSTLILLSIIKEWIFGGCDVSVNKGTCHKDRYREFRPWHPHCERKEPILWSCPLLSTFALCHECAPTHTCTHMHTHTSNKYI